MRQLTEVSHLFAATEVSHTHDNKYAQEMEKHMLHEYNSIYCEKQYSVKQNIQPKYFSNCCIFCFIISQKFDQILVPFLFQK